jgi:hypothetical protein
MMHHPRWCYPRLCTATESGLGEHVSQSKTIACRRRPGTRVSFWLRRPAASSQSQATCRLVFVSTADRGGYPSVSTVVVTADQIVALGRTLGHLCRDMVDR